MTSALNVYAQKKVVGNPDYPVRDNAEIDINQVAASRPPVPFGYKPATTTGLTFGYYGGEFLINGTLTTISDSTILLAASATNYVEANRAGTVSKNSVGFTAGLTPLYEVTTDTGSITAINDRRAGCEPNLGLISIAVGGTGDFTLTAEQARNNILTFTGVLTGNRDIIFPAPGRSWTVRNAASGGFTLTVKTNGGTGVVIAPGTTAIIYSNSTNMSVNEGSAIPAGSNMIFYNPVAPVGWTQNTAGWSHAMRVVGGVGAGVGGTQNFTDVFKSQAVTGSNSATSLTEAQTGSHRHAMPGNLGGNPGGSIAYAGNTAGYSWGEVTGYTGGGQAHNHTFTGTAINLAVRYMDMILAGKN